MNTRAPRGFPYHLTELVGTRVEGLASFISDDGVCVAVAQAVLGFEEVDLLHVLFVGDGVEEVEPVGDGFAVLLFD